MNSNYPDALRLVLIHEGGFVDHPRDPGGPTNKGVTQRVYDAFRKRQGLPTRSVRHITAEETATIYKTKYWDAVRADELPAGVDYAMFDFGVNSGPRRSIQFVQRIVGATVDGIIGPQTMRLINAMDPIALITELCNRRITWKRTLRHWDAFGRGWTRRVMGRHDGFQANDNGVIDHAINMAKRAAKVEVERIPDPKPIGFYPDEIQPAKAIPDEKPTLEELVKTKEGKAATAGTIAAGGGAYSYVSEINEATAGGDGQQIVEAVSSSGSLFVLIVSLMILAAVGIFVWYKLNKTKPDELSEF